MDTAFGRVALPVDEVMGQQQVTLKPLTGHLSAIRAGAGCAVLPSGDVAIALHADLLHRARH
jgi:chemotaxis protein histidine kinase CheA